MEYQKQTFVDQVVDAEGNVTTEGTVLKAENLNHIEDGIEAVVAQSNTNTTELGEVKKSVTTHTSQISSLQTGVSTLLSTKQDKLVSGSNIKTVNGQSVLGSGNIAIEIPEAEEQTYMLPEPVEKSVYSGLTIACVGDSVTAGVGANGNPYVTQLGTELGTTMINLGASGTVLCTGGHRTCNIGKLTETNLQGADIVTILMGVNDWDQAVKDGYFGGSLVYDSSSTYYTLGDIESEDTTTIYGALKMWCQRIVTLKQTESLANTKFYFMTPLITSWNNSVSATRNWDQNKVNIQGYKFRALCQAIIDVCALYEIPVIDLNLYSGIYYNSSTDNSTSTYGGDGIHPNEAGHTLIKDAIVRALEQNPEYKGESKALYYLLDYVSKILGTEISYPVSNAEDIVIPIESITLSASTLSLTAGETYTITATLSPDNTTQTNIVWESDNTAAVTVNNGVITAVAEGDATITCRSADNTSIVATVAVNVSAAENTDLTSLIISEEAVTVTEGNTHTLTVSYVPTNTEQTGVAWTSDDTSVATVSPSEDGLSCVVTAQGEGQCYITVTSTVNASISANCLFTTTVDNSIDVLLSSATASYDSATQVISSTSTQATSLLSKGGAKALVNEPLSNGMEIEVESFNSNGTGYIADSEADWSLLILGLSTSNVIADLDATTDSWGIPTGKLNVYQDRPGVTGVAQSIKPNASLNKISLERYWPTDGRTNIVFRFKKETDGTVWVKIADKEWLNYADNATISALTEYSEAVAAEALYFFTAGFGLTRVKINYIGAIR